MGPMVAIMKKMDYTACHVIFCDRRTQTDALVRRDDHAESHGQVDAQVATLAAPVEVKDNVKVILAAFQEVFLCRSGISCSNRLRQLEDSRQEGAPVVIFLDIDAKADFGNRPSLETELLKPGILPLNEDLDEYYGISLLRHLAMEAYNDRIGKLVIPIAIIRDGKRMSTNSATDDPCIIHLRESLKANMHASKSVQLVDPHILMKCLDAGAVDAFSSPLTPDRLQQIIVAAYKAHLQYAKERSSHLDLKRIRKRSWVGFEEERPYAYLRESMVSSLMNSICRPETVALGSNININMFNLRTDRITRLTQVLSSWSFSAHEFSDDELLYGAFLILSHCLKTPGLEKWGVSDSDLKNFLFASRAAYNSFVPYHNFRHVVDVLQALFYSLLQIGALPEYPSKTSSTKKATSSSIAKLVDPFDALVLLVSAIGHDVGHPGVNNAFLVTLKAPLAQLYNDKSVLEAFHCAAYSQILRRHWRNIYEDTEFRRLLINTILATDMGIHPEYMANLGNLQEKLHHDGGTDGWTTKLLQSNKDLLLGLLIKCADISNVARPFDTASQWAQILQLEFARQGEMERDVGMNSTLFGGPPELGNLMKLANSQIGFMNFFGLPLFESVADVMPELQYAVDEIIKNKAVWEKRIEQERSKDSELSGQTQGHSDGAHSPRSASPDRAFFTLSPKAVHQEGLQAFKATTEVLPSSDSVLSSSLPGVKRTSLFDGAEDFFTPPVSPQGVQPTDPETLRTSDVDSRQARDGYPSGFTGTKTSHPRTNVENILVTNMTATTPMKPSAEFTTSTEHRSSGGPSRNGSQNFSRPYSHHHSAQLSCTATRSSASRAPTFSSTNYPASPAETQATSLGDYSEGGSPPIWLDSSENRPLTMYSNSELLDTANDAPSRTSRASVSAINDFSIDKAHAKMRPVTSSASVTKPVFDGNIKEASGEHQIKRKSSRWKFDFWRRKRQAEKEYQAP